MRDSKAREAAAMAMTVALKTAADKIYWWDGADAEKVSGGEPEWEEYGPGVMLADRFDLQAIANAAIDAFLSALGETHAVVPREPTEAMVEAIWDVDISPSRLDDGYGATEISAVGPMAMEIYRAMFKAAEGKP